ncbi:chaperone modulatory protein CbpM [Roseimicrobium gellanilyticum]|uniref:Chaperone modulatory protein CbpM n=1 Tax=Roseimicrobium gellanilyticum TaxID=748857 RepID=A0A366HQM6_9BACT|nr:chaperone modulator CbpM [Roseimicrobium gellanilyticum]RBP45962.1 chaperone modulatory protein CbpM [Roseimicrobium gellanilyticum]
MPDFTEPHSASAHEFYAIETVSEITGTPRHTIAVYCRHGIISPVGEPDEDGWIFDDDAILRLRHVEQLRLQYGMNLAGLRAMTTLMNELEDLRREIRFLRGS